MPRSEWGALGSARSARGYHRAFSPCFTTSCHLLPSLAHPLSLRASPPRLIACWSIGPRRLPFEHVWGLLAPLHGNDNDDQDEILLAPHHVDDLDDEDVVLLAHLDDDVWSPPSNRPHRPLTVGGKKQRSAFRRELSAADLWWNTDELFVVLSNHWCHVDPAESIPVKSTGHILNFFKIWKKLLVNQLMQFAAFPQFLFPLGCITANFSPDKSKLLNLLFFTQSFKQCGVRCSCQ